jgi:hypothetical protein
MSTTTRDDETGRSAVVRLLLGLEVLLAFGASAGAIALVGGWADLGSATADLPFASTVFAGLALGLINGVLPSLVVAAELRRHPWAARGHLLVGIVLVGWVVVQVAFLGWPPQVLQVVYLAYGCAIAGLALLALWRSATRPRSERLEERTPVRR